MMSLLRRAVRNSVAGTVGVPLTLPDEVLDTHPVLRDARWRQQFVGKRAGQSLKLGSDIKNISGATLSSKHVTDGVRRLLATYQIVLAHG